jgi:pSer/pThr/pTyr-binding forkhead associated (FHA) protein
VKPPRGEHFVFALEQDVVTVGRGKRNDLALDDAWLSRQQLEIRHERDSYRAYALGRGNYVNGVRLDESASLRDGDVITLGDHQLVFLEHAP